MRPNVRSYAFGGDEGDSACDKWLLDEYLDIIWTKLPLDLLNDPKRGNPPYNFNWMLTDFWIKNYKDP